METQMAIGKVRGLSRVSNKSGVFNILAFDHRQSFAKMVPGSEGQAASFSEVVKVKQQVIRTLADRSSAVLLDPVYSAAQAIVQGALPGETGLIIALEETGYGGENTARQSEILQGWSVSKIKKMGADAVKLLVYYHPNAGELTEQQEELCIQVINKCREHDITFFLEPIVYSVDPDFDKNSRSFAEQRPQILADTAKRLGALGPDVLKLEFPVDASFDQGLDAWKEACERISSISPCPWTVLSAGVDFETFAKQVEIACQAGAAGYIGGRAIWKEGITMPEKQRINWLEQVGRTRLNNLGEITEKYAVPWRNFFRAGKISLQEDWYKNYS